MSIKTMIQKWLGIEPPKQRVSAARAYQAPIQNTYQPTLQRLPFERTAKPTNIKFKRYGKSPSDIRQFYDACGGYNMFAKIMRHSKWYTVNQRQNDSQYPYVLIVIDNDSKTQNGNFESRSFRVTSYEEGHAYAQRIVEIHIREMNKRNIH